MTAQEMNKLLVDAGYVLHGNKVAVAREKTKEVSAGGIIIPQTAQSRSSFGQVVFVGEGQDAEGKEALAKLEVGLGVGITKYRGVFMDQRIKDDTYSLEILNILDLYFTWPEEPMELEVGDSLSGRMG